jgi:hypothetical protein
MNAREDIYVRAVSYQFFTFFVNTRFPLHPFDFCILFNVLAPLGLYVQ